MAKQLKGLKAKMDQMRQGRQDIERLAHVRVRESESALADLLQENNMLREALEKLQSGSAGPADTDKDRLEREELERLKKQLHAAEQESQYYKEEFERWRRQAASVEDRLVATSGALQERTIAAQKLQERVVELETELARVLAAPAAVVEPALPPCKDLSDELGAAIAERDAAVQRASSLQSEVDELRRALALQKQESEAAISAVKLQAEQTESARAQLESGLEASRRECSDVKAAADAAVAAAEVGLKIAKGQRDELENDLKDAKRVAQATQERQTATIIRLERELEESKRKLDESLAEVQASKNSHRGEIKKMQDLLKMMQEQLEALQASRSGPVPTKVVVVTPRIFITIPSGQSMEYGTMELPPRVIRQLVTQQLGYEPLEIIQAKTMEEVQEIKKKL